MKSSKFISERQHRDDQASGQIGADARFGSMRREVQPRSPDSAMKKKRPAFPRASFSFFLLHRITSVTRLLWFGGRADYGQHYRHNGSSGDADLFGSSDHQALSR